MLWTNQVLPLLVQRDSLNTSRSKDRTVSLFFLPKPLHSPHPLGSYIALPSSRSLLKTKMAKVCARSRRSNGKIGDFGVFSNECSTFLEMMNDIGIDKTQQHYIIKKMISLAIRATYFIFCRRNKTWDSPDLIKV